MLTKNELDRLEEVFEQFPEIQAVYLFGSYATGQERAESDLDLGIFTDQTAQPSFKLKLLTAMTKNGFTNLDLVMLNEADPVVRYEAIRPNKIIYSKRSFEHSTMFSRVMREYFDILPLLKVQRKALKERMQNA